MTPHSEFVPVQKPISTSHKLEFNFRDQEHLLYTMKHTARELEESALVVPTYQEVVLGRIALRDASGKRSRTDMLQLQFSEAAETKGQPAGKPRMRRSAMIDLRQGYERTRIKLTAMNGVWEVFTNDSHEAAQYLSNQQLVSELYPKLMNPDGLKPLLDVAQYDSMQIPHMLASHLEKSSGRREKKTLFTVNRPLIQGLDGIVNGLDSTFVSTTDTSLSTYVNNGRTIHTLATAAPYEIGETTIRKEYIYSAETNSTSLLDSKAGLVISSSDGYNRAQLDGYAQSDLLDNEPLFALHRGITNLRTHNGLSEEI